MGSFSVTFGTTASPRTQTKTVQDALFASKIVPALQTYYGQVSDGAGGFRDRTNNELMDALFDTLTATVKRIVRSGEQDTSDKTITDLPMT